jgi:IS1 family transposase
MNKLTAQRRTQILAALVEGNSIRSTCRMTGAAKGIVLSLLETAGWACRAYHNPTVQGVTCQRLQCDEIWSFCYAKERNLTPEHEGQVGYGDVWTWVALDADTKLAVDFIVGDRSAAIAHVFMKDTAARLANRVQLTTDGHKPYLEAVEGAFGSEIDYAQLIKIYGADPDGDHRYSPAACIGTETKVIQGNSDQAHASTSYVERQNLTMRLGMRRFTRLTNGFSNKIDNLAHAVSLHFLYYNFCRPHKTLKGATPAMAAGLAFHVWEVMEIVALIEAYESVKSGDSK